MNDALTLNTPRVLLVGYNGANNTGAEALLQVDIEDVRAVVGRHAHITVPSLNAANLRRYLHEGPNLTISPMPTLFFDHIRRLVQQHDLVMLVEGSTYMDTWGSPLLWAFLWATHCAATMGKPVLAYAVDAGTLSPANQRRVRAIASRTGLIVTRTAAAATRLQNIGVTAPIECTADNAFNFTPREADRQWVQRDWPQARRGLVGLAVVDFFLWPAVMRLWGRAGRCYKWPYFFSSSPLRTQSTDRLARGFAGLADRIVEKTGKAVALIGMEQVDEALTRQVLGYMRNPASARCFSARTYDASQMTALLQSLDLLVTSRFHAAVLSLAATVPQVAIGHDQRLATLYQDCGLAQRWFLDPQLSKNQQWPDWSAQLFTQLQQRVDNLLDDPAEQKAILYKGYLLHRDRARRNRDILAEFVAKNLYPAMQPHSSGGDLPVLIDNQGGAAWAA